MVTVSLDKLAFFFWLKKERAVIMQYLVITVSNLLIYPYAILAVDRPYRRHL